MHFFNPAPVMKLVEVVRTVVTEPEVVDDVEALAERLGKADVTIGDRAGFIANALLFGYLNHAVAMYENRYASREDIDAAMRLGCGLPMGPLALMDLIGLDTAYEILDTMYKQSRDRLHAPSPIIKQMVTAGLLGRKTGRGFYTYAEAGLRRGRRRRRDAGRRRRRRGRPAGARPSAWSAPARWPPASSRSSPRAATTSGSSPAAPEKVEAVAQGAGQVAGEAGAARQARPRPSGTPILARVTGTTTLDDLADRDLVIEAVVEELSVKEALFANLDEIAKPGAVLATTTSSLPVIECAKASGRPADVVGMHFFNPAPVMKLVEVVCTVSTAPDVAATALAVCEQLGKHAVLLRRPGRASSSTPCCSRTSTTRSRCWRRTTPPPTTSTRP